MGYNDNLSQDQQDHYTATIKQLLDKGQLIEAGWLDLRYKTIAMSAATTQIEEMRMAFFAGAQHLFSSIITALDPDAEPTQTDMYRMHQIHNELQVFIGDFIEKHNMHFASSAENPARSDT